MNTRKFYPGLAVVLALELAALACGGGRGAEPSATPFVKATLAVPTATEAEAEPTPEPEATEAPKPTRTPRAQATSAPAPFTLSSEAYTHPSGAFVINLPEAWEVEERDNSIFVSAPDSVASMEVSFVNVGVELDAEALDKFIQANEANWFGTFENYAQEAVEPQADGSLGVLKTLEDGGAPHTVFSYYWLEGTVVYEQDFWVQTEHYDAYLDSLLEVANSMQTDPDVGAETDIYAVTYTFVDPIQNLFQFNVPYGWTYTTDSGENAVLETFTSPDGLAYADNISYDDGQAVSKSEAGRFALALLKEYYEIDDIKVTDDVVQADGSERLDWYSPSGGFTGESFFETRGTTFLLLTWVADDDYYDLYLPVWSSLLDSYEVPEQ